MASLHPFIGGHNNANFGEISAEWEVTVTEIDNLTPKSLGKIGFDDTGFYSTVEGFDANAVTKKILMALSIVGSFVRREKPESKNSPSNLSHNSIFLVVVSC